MSSLSWLSDKEFAQLLATAGHTPDLCAEAARRFEALVDMQVEWEGIADDYVSAENLKAHIEGLETELAAEASAVEDYQERYDRAVNELEGVKDELEELRLAVASEERVCAECGARQ